MKVVNLNPLPLTEPNFAKFGEVVSINSNKSITINNGYAEKYCDLATIDTRQNNGSSTTHICRAKARKFPLKINMMEYHPAFSQLFMPLQQQKFLVVVAPKASTLDVNKIQAFVTDGNQGVNYFKGTWHFPLISMQNNADFLIIDRLNSDSITEQCIEHMLNDCQIQIEAFSC